MQNPTPDPGALATLDNIEFVRRLARSLLSDGHQAEDVAQDTWRVVLERWTGQAPARAWLAGVVRRLALGRVRAGLRRAELEELAASEVAADHPDPVRTLAVGQQLMQAVGRLVPDQRDAIVMRYLEGCSNGEIARRHGVRPEVVRKRVSRGLAELRLLMEGENDSLGRDWRAALAPIAGATPRLSILGAVASVKWGVAAAVIVGLVVALRWAGSGSGPAPLPPATQGPLAAEPAALAEHEVDPPDEETSRMEVTVSDAVAPSAPPLSTAGILRIEVVDAGSGVPLVGARAWIDRGDGVESPVTLEGGALELARAPALSLALAAPDHVATLLDEVELAAAGEILRVPLDPSSTVAGRVVFATGTLPDVAPFDLHTSDVELDDEWPESFAEAMGDWLPFASVRPIELAVDGSFAIGGLPAQWRGGLWVHSRFLFESADPEPALMLPVWLQIDEPRTDLEIHMVELPRMVGRVLWAEDGAPVTAARVEMTMTFVDGSKSTRAWVPVDAAGRFEMGISSQEEPFERIAVESVRISLYPEGGAVTRLDRDGLEGVGDVDLGDLVVERVPDVWLRVSDESDAPLAGAAVFPSVRATGVRSPAHARTDADGRVRLVGLPEKGVTLLVGAAGHRAEGLRLRSERGTEAEPLELSLEAAPSVTVAVDAAPEVVDRLRLELDAAEPGAFAEPSKASGVSAHRVAQLRAVLAGGRPELPNLREFRLGADGEVELFDLRPGAELDLRIVSIASGELWSRRVVAPEADDLRIEVALDPPTVRVRGRVVDAEGRGIGGVSNGLAVDGRELYHHPLTALDGSFEIVEVMDPQAPLDLLLSRLGGMERTLGLPAGRVEHDLGDIELEAGRSVDVVLIDALGRELTADVVWAELGSGATVRGGIFGSGLQVSRLPSEPVTLFVAVGGVVYERALGAGSAVASFELPAHGRLRFSAPNGAERTFETVTVRRDGGGSTDLLRPASVDWSVDLLPGTYRIVDAEGERTVDVAAGATVAVEAR